ncbi:hypothetical protein TUN199_06113, partial [Pyrenophora tritici-repentis]
LSAPVARAVEIPDISLATKKSMSLPDPSRSGLETRGIESGTFIIKWIHALDNSKDLTFRAAIIYLQGQVFAPSGSGVYASPIAEMKHEPGQILFRVTFLSASGVYTAVARVLFDTIKGAIVSAIDEGLEENGKHISNFFQYKFDKS